MDTSSPAETAATDPESASTVTTTSEAVVVEGAVSSADAVDEWFGGLTSADLPRMWAIFDPELKSTVRRAAWEACIKVQFPERPDQVSFVYDEADVYIEDGSTYSTGPLTVDGEFETATLPVTVEVVERDSGWFVVGDLGSGDDRRCLTEAGG